MKGLRRGDVKRRKVADAAVGRVARLLAHMGLGPALSGKGRALPEATSTEWQQQPPDLRVVVMTSQGARIEQWWPRKAIDALPADARGLMRIVDVDDFAATSGEDQVLPSDWQCVFLEGTVPEAVLDVLEKGMRMWHKNIDALLKDKNVGQLLDIIALAEFLPVPSLTGAAKAAKGKLERENTERESRREDKAGAQSTGPSAQPGGGASSKSDAGHSELLAIQKVAGEHSPLLTDLQALMDPSSDYDPPNSGSPTMLSFDTSTGASQTLHVMLGSQTHLGTAKALLFDLGVDFFKMWGPAEYLLWMRQQGWESSPVGLKGRPIPSGEEAASYDKLMNTLKAAATDAGQVIKVMKVNGKNDLMTALIDTPGFPTFIICLTDLRIGGPGLSSNDPAGTSSTCFEGKTTPAMQSSAKRNYLMGQMVDQYVAMLRTSNAPPLVIGGDHYEQSLAACASSQAHPSKGGEPVVCFSFFHIDPRLATRLMLQWTKCAEDYFVNKNRRAFPSRLLSAWTLLKQGLLQLKCDTVTEAEAVAVTLKELQCRQEKAKPSNHAEDKDSQEDERLLLNAIAGN